jgi:MFS family permease
MDQVVKLDDDRVALRRSRMNVLRLAAGQALAGANASVIYATAAIIGATTAPSAALATLPISIFVVGTATGTLPAGWLARHYGRRTAFIAGTACGCLTGLIAALATLIGSFPLFCVATLFGGMYASVVMSFRFAATDGVRPDRQARALSWVMVGGIFAGVIGPQMLTWTMDLWPPHLFVISFLAQAGIALITMAVLAGVDLPKQTKSQTAAGRPLSLIVRQPRFLVAVLCGVVSYTLMNIVMTSAPLAMRMCGLPQADSNFAIQWHIVGMYLPSFFTGALVARFGPRRIVATGFLLIIVAASTGIGGTSNLHFIADLVLLGVGWNFGFVGASAMVLETHRPEERTKVQAFNDFLVFGTMAIGSFSSGALLTSEGWAAVNWLTVPIISIALVILIFGSMRRKALLF